MCFVLFEVRIEFFNITDRVPLSFTAVLCTAICCKDIRQDFTLSFCMNVLRIWAHFSSSYELRCVHSVVDYLLKTFPAFYWNPKLRYLFREIHH